MRHRRCEKADHRLHEKAQHRHKTASGKIGHVGNKPCKGQSYDRGGLLKGSRKRFQAQADRKNLRNVFGASSRIESSRLRRYHHADRIYASVQRRNTEKAAESIPLCSCR